MPDAVDTPPHTHTHGAPMRPSSSQMRWVKAGALAWPAWLRVLMVCPALLVLWLLVYWANPEVGSW